MSCHVMEDETNIGCEPICDVGTIYIYIGALLDAATLRRAHRSKSGSSEGKIPNPIPQGMVRVTRNDDDDDGSNLTVSVFVESTHNAGVNATATTLDNSLTTNNAYSSPVSPANLLVTEMMILSGEAMGKWGMMVNKNNNNDKGGVLRNDLKLPYRSQVEPGMLSRVGKHAWMIDWTPFYHTHDWLVLCNIIPPLISFKNSHLDFRTREREASYLESRIENNKGNGYCSTWYSRRFFPLVKISEEPLRHSSMGLGCYLQWSSPIRRFGDLQVSWLQTRYHVEGL